MKKGENIKDMAKKYGCSPKFTEKVCRIIATHPGVTAEGIRLPPGRRKMPEYIPVDHGRNVFGHFF